MKTILGFIMTVFLIIFMHSFSQAQLGLWTSAQELADKPMSGTPWQYVKNAADVANPNSANVSDQNSNNNVEILAAGIMYARTDDESYRNKVISACEKLVNAGKPDDRTLAWARETGAYALAADLVGYRTPKFETWCRNMAEIWIATDDRTLLSMFKQRPNNWGTQAFGSLCALYAYLQDTTRLNEIRDYWIQLVLGPKPAEAKYGSDISWHVDPNNLRLINPKGAEKGGLIIDGVVPDDMRRGGSFHKPPGGTGYAWETLQGMVMGARILERIGMPIWDVADSAIYRAGYCIQVRWQNDFGGWAAEGDDQWMLKFYDDAYSTRWSNNQERLWDHGKNTGWPYVVWEETTDIKGNNSTFIPEKYHLYQNYPNPFNPVTNIHFDLPQSGPVNIAIFDLTGRKLSTLIDGFRSAGTYSQVWKAVDEKGCQLPCGIYLARLQADFFVKTAKMILTK